MRPDDMTVASNVVPLLRYRDVAAAIEWLCNSFGFERHFVVGGEGGRVLYAQLTSGSGVIMLGPVSDSEFDKLFKQPDEIGGVETQSCYLTVDDIDAHFERAKSSGAEIVFDLQNGHQGATGYSCRDLEGHIWNFGTYDPWRGKRAPGLMPRGDVRIDRPARRGLGRDMLMLSLCVAALAVTFSILGQRGFIDLPERPWSELVPGNGNAVAITNQQTEKGSAELAARHQAELEELVSAVGRARLELAAAIEEKDRVEATLRAADTERKSVEQAADAARRQAGAAEDAQSAARMTAEELRRQLDLEIDARIRATRLGQDARSELENEREARAGAQRTADELNARLAGELKAKETAQRATSAAQAAESEARQRLAIAEQALARAGVIASDAGPSAGAPIAGLPAQVGAAPVAVVGRDTGTKVKAWSSESEQPSAELTRKKKSAAPLKRRVRVVRNIKKPVVPPVVPSAPTSNFPPAQF